MAKSDVQTAKVARGKAAKAAKQVGAKEVPAKVELATYTLAGAKKGTLTVAGPIFSGPIDATLVHDTVRWQRSKARAGTHSALTRTMMEGGQKKPFKQKHTGRARAGSSVSPLWVGGASIHGPLPRDYETRVPKRTRRQALISALSDKVQTDRVRVIADVKLKEQKTKEFAGMIKALGLETGSSLFVFAKGEEMTARSARNMGSVNVIPVAGLNVYDLLKHDYLIGSEAAFNQIGERLAE